MHFIITMQAIIRDNKLTIIAKPKTIHFDLTKKFENSLKH